ncbi:uncharacterized protein LOC131165912 isoform X3 [Malania oleifera]|uniref:uncharacterized protein LOC131165912 isoform X3 n=1 Tax=Malania oleifera TaxID=397392 RepID=UPI0025AE4CB7|nr:uncharacterized protein LOC131165912 isoform X3 [Malania oleifera]
MPPPSCRDGDRSNLPAGETFNFFKIISPDDVRDGKLRFPPKFVRKYGKKLSNPVLVKVPNGSIWKVELMKCDGGVWLQNGWREFSKYYSISQGHFLIFKYEGFSRFLVIICDMTASEIEYPFSDTDHKDSDNAVELGAHMEKVENDASVEILGEFPMCQKSHCEESIFVGKLKAPKLKEIEDDLSVEILEDFPTSQKKLGKQPSRFPCSRMIKTEPPSEIKNASALQNPVMNFQQKDLQANGMKLAGSKRDLDGHQVMQDLAGNWLFGKWSLAFESLTAVFFLAGGHKYVKEGDNGSRDMEWRSPQAKYPEGSGPATVNEELTALQAANAFKPENPFHIVTMRQSYVGSGCWLRIPLRSVKDVFSRKCGEVTLQVSDGRTWPIKYTVGVGGANLTSGWKTFVLDNHLKVGDICVFEQIKGLDNSLKVVMFRACEVGNLNQSGHKYVNEEDNGSRDKESRSPQAKYPEGSGPATVKEEFTALQAANAFKPENPFHIVTLRPSYVSTGCWLRFPLRSVQGVFSRKCGEVTIQVSDGRTWPIKYTLGPCGAHLSSGWKTFVLDNHLKVGDICVFEQSKGLDNSLKVVMFRACEDGTNCFPTVQKLEI